MIWRFAIPPCSGDQKLWLEDAEDGWFVRVDHITEYGTDPSLEKLTAVPPKPLLFLNIESVPGGRAMIWDHIYDEPGKPCPNPRVVLPRDIVPKIVSDRSVSTSGVLGCVLHPVLKKNPITALWG